MSRNDTRNLGSAGPGRNGIALTTRFSDANVLPGGLGFGICAIDLPERVDHTIDGGGNRIDGAGPGGSHASGLAAISGMATIADLTLEDTHAQGGNGLGDDGGGAGLGGGLFVGAEVDADDLTITKAKAVGGADALGGSAPKRSEGVNMPVNVPRNHPIAVPPAAMRARAREPDGLIPAEAWRREKHGTI
jgi:hypothetical protein